MSDTVTLIPINPTDRDLMRIMTAKTAPRWMRVAACLALEGRKVVLIKDGLPVLDQCAVCVNPQPARLRVLHKSGPLADPAGVVACPTCGRCAENRPLAILERRAENGLNGLRAAF